MSRLLAFLALLGAAHLCVAEIRVFDRAQTEALGRKLYEIQRRTDIAVQLMNEHEAPDELQVGAWVIEGEPPRLLIRFVRLTGADAEPVLDAQFDDLLLPSFTTPPDNNLSAFQRSQIVARDTVRTALDAPCSRQYESVAVADPAGDGLLLYALALGDERTEVLLGGHYRFSLSADGTTLRQADALSTSCVKAPRAKLAASDGVKGIAVRAHLSDTPLETHVYLSLRHRVPLYVVTRDLKMWEVRDGHMRVIRERPGELSTATRVTPRRLDNGADCFTAQREARNFRIAATVPALSRSGSKFAPFSVTALASGRISCARRKTDRARRPRHTAAASGIAPVGRVPPSPGPRPRRKPSIAPCTRASCR